MGRVPPPTSKCIIGNYAEPSSAYPPPQKLKWASALRGREGSSEGWQTTVVGVLF